MYCKSNQSKNMKGITLIALVVTIIILIILSTISVNLVIGNGGLIGKVKNTKNNYVDIIDGENKKIEELYAERNKRNLKANGELNNDEGEGNEEDFLELAINLNTTNYNETLGNFPVVFNVTEKKDEEIIYEDLAVGEIENVGQNSIYINIPVVKGASVEVKPAYSNANYNISEQLKTVTISDNYAEDKDFYPEVEFELKYNNKVITSEYKEVNF